MTELVRSQWPWPPGPGRPGPLAPSNLKAPVLTPMPTALRIRMAASCAFLRAKRSDPAGPDFLPAAAAGQSGLGWRLCRLSAAYSQSLARCGPGTGSDSVKRLYWRDRRPTAPPASPDCCAETPCSGPGSPLCLRVRRRRLRARVLGPAPGPGPRPGSEWLVSLEITLKKSLSCPGQAQALNRLRPCALARAKAAADKA